MTNKTISVIPYGGLCNRICAMVSGINIAKEMNAKCVIYWNNTHDCRCDFSDMFEYPDLSNVSVVENKTLTHSLSRKRNLYFPSFLRRLSYDCRIFHFNWDGGKRDIFKLIPQDSNKILLLSCCQMFDINGIGGGKILRPKYKLQTRIDDITRRFGKRIVGIHIRGTDHINSRTNSPFNAFINRINDEMKKNKNTTFYVATDEIEYKKKLIELYGDKIIVSPEILNRNSLVGMEGALVDLYCLSSTNYIIGSYKSSFSKIAAAIGGVELIIARLDC
ncbi:MAG: hypothetical protein LUC88_00040 [Prevotella sp.]|nr:hypothetical protein [Prevotella sp.]